MRPAHAEDWIKRFYHIVGNESERQAIVTHLLLDFVLQFYRLVGKLPRMQKLKVTVENENQRRRNDQRQCTKTVLDK